MILLRSLVTEVTRGIPLESHRPEALPNSLVPRVIFTSAIFVVILAGNDHSDRAQCSKNHLFFLSFAVLYISFRLFNLVCERIEDISRAEGILREKSTKSLRTNQNVLFETRQFHSFICMKKFSSFVEC